MIIYFNLFIKIFFKTKLFKLFSLINMKENLLGEDELETDNNNDKEDYILSKVELGPITKEGSEKEENYLIERNIKNNQSYNKSIKIILLGDSHVGKTSIIRRVCFNDFEENISSTISIEYFDYFIKINDYILRMQIWDTSDKEKYNSIVKNHFLSTDYAIYIYSLDNIKSFNTIKEWLSNFQKDNPDNKIVKILLANKNDIEEDKRKITFKEGENLAKEYKCAIFKEISCKNDEEPKNILDIFDQIAKSYYNYNKQLKRTSIDSESLSYEASKTIYEISENSNSNSLTSRNEKCCCCCCPCCCLIF